MRLKKFLLLVALILSFSGCDAPKAKEPVNVSSDIPDSSIIEINSCQFKLTSSLGGLVKNIVMIDSCFIYWDKVTDTCYAKFNTAYGGIIVELLDSDGTPKSYSEDNKNELILIEQGKFLIFEDTDTGIQYIITSNYSNYVVRRTETGELYIGNSKRS